MSIAAIAFLRGNTQQSMPRQRAELLKMGYMELILMPSFLIS